MKTPLLFLCHRIPYPPNKGDKIRSFHLLHHLSQHFDIHMGTFVDDPEDWPWVPEVEKFCASLKCLPLNPRLARVRSLGGLATGKVLSLPYYRDRAMARWVRETLARHDIAHLLVFSAAMAQYVMKPEQSFRRRVIDFVDVDSDKWLQYAGQKPWPMSWIYRREGELLLDFEREVAARFDAGLFVSGPEAEMFRGLAPESAHKVGYYNNGVNTEYFRPDPGLANPYGAGERALVFTGAMDYWPNIDAVDWFTREVFPSMARLGADLQFYIVGSNPGAAVLKLNELPGVHVTGRVEDVRPYIQHALAAVAPMRIARGVQNKVLEAMAMEKPVIVSDKGLEGIHATHEEHVLLANNVGDYLDCVGELLAGAHGGIGHSARQQICSHFSWDENLPEVVYLLHGEGDEEYREAAHVG